MAKWFYQQGLLMQILLLIIPGVNWIVEIGVRFSAYSRTKNLLTLIFAVITIPAGMIFGWLDFLWLLLTGHLLFAKA